MNILNSLDLVTNVLNKKTENVLSSLSNLFMNNKWWKNADNLKKSGFYVDLKDQNWSNPSQIDKISYEEAVDVAENLLEWLRKSIEFISEDTFKFAKKSGNTF